MLVSANAIVSLRGLERCVLKVYPDQHNLPTIGIGHLMTKSELMSGHLIINGTPVNYKDGITEEQARLLCAQDLLAVELWVSKLVRVKLTQGQFDALVLFCYNIGDEAFATSSALRVLNADHYDEVPADMRLFNKVAHVVSQGLINRREAEIKIWNGEG